MKHYNLLFLILLTLTSTPSQSEEMTVKNTEFASLFNPQETDHILLVGFEDRHINRIQNVSSSYHRRGGNYNSSTWSKRITTQIETEYGLKKLTEWPMTEVDIHCVVYRIPANRSVEKTIAQLAQDKRVEIVQRMHLFKTKTHQYNDPYYKLQSNMHDMQIDQAHKMTTGKNIKIAMIDTGVDMNHPDLKGQIEFNQNFVHGISPSFSTDMHGTAVAGVLIAHSNNEKGIIGVAPNARLIALKACWPSSANAFEATCNSFTLALAVNTAIKLDAKILNMSLIGPQDPLLEILLNKAIKKGMVVVAADSSSKNDSNRFPASLKNVISVQSMKISFTNKTTKNQSIIAQGENVLTTIPRGTYDFISGSSLAAAQVSGIVALLLELKPEMTLVETKQILQNSVLASCSATNKELSYGINANIAILELCDQQRCPKNI